MSSGLRLGADIWDKYSRNRGYRLVHCTADICNKDNVLPLGPGNLGKRSEYSDPRLICSFPSPRLGDAPGVAAL